MTRAEAGRRLGDTAVDFLQKPYTGFQLVEKVRDVLRNKRK